MSADPGRRRPPQSTVGATWCRQTRRPSGDLLLGGGRDRLLHAVRVLQERAGRLDAGPDPPTGATGARGIQMKDAACRELVASVRQAGRIRRGTLRASRTRVFRPADIKAVRAKLGASQSEFALMIG